MKWTADVFDIEYKETRNFDTMLSLLKNNHYVIAVCNERIVHVRRTFYRTNTV